MNIEGIRELSVKRERQEQKRDLNYEIKEWTITYEKCKTKELYKVQEEGKNFRSLDVPELVTP